MGKNKKVVTQGAQMASLQDAVCQTNAALEKFMSSQATLNEQFATRITSCENDIGELRMRMWVQSLLDQHRGNNTLSFQDMWSMSLQAGMARSMFPPAH